MKEKKEEGKLFQMIRTMFFGKKVTKCKNRNSKNKVARSYQTQKNGHQRATVKKG